MRKFETTGEKRRGSVTKAIPVKFTVVVKTLRAPFWMAPPKLGSKKYFILTSQVTNSSAPAGTQGPAGDPVAGEAEAAGAAPGSSLQPECSRLRKRRWSRPYSTSLVLLRMSRKSKRMMREKSSTPLV